MTKCVALCGALSGRKLRSAVGGASCPVRCLVWALCVARVGCVRSTVCGASGVCAETVWREWGVCGALCVARVALCGALCGHCVWREWGVCGALCGASCSTGACRTPLRNPGEEGGAAETATAKCGRGCVLWPGPKGPREFAPLDNRRPRTGGGGDLDTLSGYRPSIRL